MPRLYGLSLSFCVSDMVRGVVDPANVEGIISATAARSESDWKRVFESYQESYWRHSPWLCRLIASYLVAAERVYQPRVEHDYCHSIAGGHWVEVPDEG